ncbi:sensor histidine kinase [Phormidesmis priestleyi ULC007]|uniref:histidine kinase n=1 Tax=Phormidesmis priestleyi ULC007 TaxID=1920490 RepID=A0A2T1DM81_9CYAN|nr:HAMP domain-containing sensor histidine kinase [Phormidesmis priestleyi]PSB21589.1 sensor histidine kinase [Phormidesmis priestleyi ULC007]PZO54630.1 MAG: sensor histidine kinase [Phormidesmis priestleyi]
MLDLSQLLSEKIEVITQQWVEAVSDDRQIKSADSLPRSAIRNHIPMVLKALVTILSQSEVSDTQTVIRDSLVHGSERAEQGFDAAEIAREYHLLRSALFRNLQPDLINTTTAEVFRVMSLIDQVIDEATAQCFKSYMQERLQELENLQTQLMFNNEELSRLIRASQKNFSHLAHELKTPLSSIIGYSELFLRQQRRSELEDSVPSLEHIDRVVRNGRRLLRLINDALELSRNETSEIELQLEWTDVRSVIHSVLEVVQPLADARALPLLWNCTPDFPSVLIDSFRLQQILINLMSNAIRYTQTGSVTLACCVLNNEQWTMSVIDTGIGILPDVQARIFDPFFRGQPSDASQIADSTGLGLAIVDLLVKRLQGTISVTSEVGKGSTFTIVLPIET